MRKKRFSVFYSNMGGVECVIISFMLLVKGRL